MARPLGSWPPCALRRQHAACDATAPARPPPQAGINQWSGLAAPAPEKAAVYTLLPRAVRTLLGGLTGAAVSMGAPPAAALGMAVQQWADCGVLVSAGLRLCSPAA